mmetsp:Transcript_103647/g.288748  ORF Transcript_103647/g.288748 Transcript_103647/m.288748 type:complete len:246 (-) Transcript_103647:53-790(-)
MASRLFGKKKKPVEAPAGPSLDEVISKSDGRVSALDEKINALNKELRGYQLQLKKAKGGAASSIKMRATQALKRRKMYTQQRDAIMATSFNVEQTNFAIQSAKDTADTVSAMSSAAVALKAEHKKIDIDKVEDIQDDLADLMADAEEINELMGRSYGLDTEVDEGELDDELAALEDEWDAEGEMGDDVGESTTVPAYLAPPVSATGEADGEAVAGGAGGGGAAPVVAAGVPTDEFGLPVAPATAT